MTDDLNNADKILNWMHEQAANKEPIDPLRWLEAAIKLEILSSDETDKQIELESKVASIRAGALNTLQVAAKAKIFVEATDEFKEMRRQQKKCEQIMEMVRLAKKFATLKSDELRNNL